MSSKNLLLSIKPRFADLIFNGTKTVELRRTQPKVKNGDAIVVYISSPVMQVAGTATVTSVESDTPALLWRRVRNLAGVSKKEFDKYFLGSNTAVAIHLKDPKTLDFPVSLEALRREYAINPPQSFRYLSKFPIS